MKYRSILIVFLGIAGISILSSCDTLFYGTSTKVAIETDKEFADSVNIVAVGCNEVVEYKNVSLPYKMKVKHRNLPLHITVNSKTDKYESFIIDSKNKGGKIGPILMSAGAIIGLGSALIMQEKAGPIAYPSLAAMVVGIPSIPGVYVPEYKSYLTKSSPLNATDSLLNEDWFLRLEAINDVYSLLKNKEYYHAKAKVEWLLDKGETGELYYLRGLTYYQRDKLKKAQKDILQAQKMINPETNPGLYNNVVDCLKLIKKARKYKKEKRMQMWGDIASGLLQAGAATFQTYAQTEYLKNMQNSGITSSGIVTDPSKLSQAQLNQLMDPNFAYQQVMQQEYMEFQEFSRYNKKSDGSNYSFDEFQAFKGQALLNLIEEGIDLVAEQREQNRKDRQEWRESLEQDRKNRLEQAKARLNGTTYDAETNSSTSTSSFSSSSSFSSTEAVSSTATPQTTTAVSNTETEDLDSKEQFRRETVSSEDYQKIKDVTLYYREGDKAKVMMNSVELCRKGANYYIKIGNTYYPRRASNWSKYRNAIAYGHYQLYYND